MLILKINFKKLKNYYFNIFLNKKTFKKTIIPIILHILLINIHNNT
jgi:hypothetical protein